MTRIAWILVGICAAALAMAQVARPPDAPPVLPHSFDGNLVPARPLSDLPKATQDEVARAMATKDCAAATAALTSAYIREYPQFERILTDRDTLWVWWREAGRQAYADIYICDVIGDFTAAAAQYEASGGEFRWCGQSLLTEPSPDKESMPALYRLISAINELLPMTSEIDSWAPFSVDALRAILTSDEYSFVVLPEPVRFNILLILEHTTDLSPDEEAELNALAERIPSYKKQLMMDFIDTGYEFGNRAEFRECMASAR